MNKSLSLFLLCVAILLVSCSPKEKIGYLGKTRTEIINEKGKPVEDEKELGHFDEAIAYGKDFLNYEVFYFKKDICTQHNETYPVEKFNEKYEKLKEEFGEPVKKGDGFLFADSLKDFNHCFPNPYYKFFLSYS